MDFARKQLEKYGWKEGDGLGKIGNEGIKTAIKPHYKTGKAGMGFDLAKELTDTWWTRSLDASLKNINVETDSTSGSVVVSRPEIEGSECRDNPSVQMKRRMAKANFREFSKGGTLTQEGIVPEISGSDDEPPRKKSLILSDDELLKACGGRTAHKGARHGLRLSGKLARLAAQDAYLMAHSDGLKEKGKKKSKKSKRNKDESKAQNDV